MKVGLYLENANIPDIDFSHLEAGNPGCGGTEYLFAALPHYLHKWESHRCHPVLFANHPNALPPHIETHFAENAQDAARKAKQAGCAIFIYRPKRKSEMDILDVIQQLALPTIMWVHVTPTMRYVRKIAQSPFVRAFVCVEHEQHDTLYDSPLREKLTYIVNGFDLEGFRADTPPAEKDKNLIVYIGALVPQKGFHLLARAWPRILERNPQARLTVIGTGSVYNSNAQLGPWGIADHAYETNSIIPYLAGTDGNPLPSVTFAGRLGHEKKELLSRAWIGVPNPSGEGENCPGSALEFEASGTAVVSGAREGMLDTIQHGKTGLLGRGADALINNITLLLEYHETTQAYARNGIEFVRERYDYQTVAREWGDLFERLTAEKAPQQKSAKRNLLTNFKILRVLNRQLQNTIGRIVPWPCLEEIKETIIYVRRQLKK